MVETMLDDPVVTVHVPEFLRGYTRGADETMVCGVTVAEALASLGREHPGILAEVLTTEGGICGIRESVEVFLGGTNVLELQGLETPIGFEELIAIVPVRRAARP